MGMHKKVDVISQFNKDGTVIPLKVRLEDEDGIMQEFRIRTYKEVAAFRDGFTMPNEVKIAPSCTQKKFECKIEVIGREQKFFLIFNRVDLTWWISTY